MPNQQKLITHYKQVRQAAEGNLPDGRSVLGKTLKYFRKRLREPFGQFNALQEARELVDVPLMVFYFGPCQILTKDNRLTEDYKWAHGAMERLIKDIYSLADKDNSKGPKLADWIEQQEGKKP